jgi:hypothetical protein
MSAKGQVQTSGSRDLEAKRLELLKDTVSGLSRGARYATGIIRSNGEPPWQDKAADRAALSSTSDVVSANDPRRCRRADHRPPRLSRYWPPAPW